MNSPNLQKLYQETILKYNKQPQNYGVIESYSHLFTGQNRMCGDYIDLYLSFENERENRLQGFSFEGEGCAIMKASASIMTELMKGKSQQEIEVLVGFFYDVVYERSLFQADIGEANIFAGLSKFPSRMQCALLPWDALRKGLSHE